MYAEWEIKNILNREPCPHIPEEYRMDCWACDGKGYTEKMVICFGDPGHYIQRDECPMCCGRGYIEDTMRRRLKIEREEPNKWGWIEKW